jgi:hypothetical protein
MTYHSNCKLNQYVFTKTMIIICQKINVTLLVKLIFTYVSLGFFKSMNIFILTEFYVVKNKLYHYYRTFQFVIINLVHPLKWGL